jgi:hypothetical protein
VPLYIHPQYHVHPAKDASREVERMVQFASSAQNSRRFGIREWTSRRSDVQTEEFGRKNKPQAAVDLPLDKVENDRFYQEQNSHHHRFNIQSAAK